MAALASPQLSVVVPLYNEAAGLPAFHDSLIAVLATLKSYEVIYVDDGSSDDGSNLVQSWHAKDPRIKLIKLSRNFGKENALSAGIAQASGAAVLMIDGDGQHPVELIPRFLQAWREGAQVVVGVRTVNQREGWFKHIGSRLFYIIFNKVGGQKLVPGSTDYRLIDAAVRSAFLDLKETDRLTRGLIDWLGFRRKLIYFEAAARRSGSAGYSRGQLMKLAANSFVSLTPTPIYLFGYLGIFITTSAFLLGSAVIIEQLFLGDPWHWNFTGTAMLGILIVFLVGIVLLSQGILSLYISHIHSQSKQRPLYVIDYQASAGIKQNHHDA